MVFGVDMFAIGVVCVLGGELCAAAQAKSGTADNIAMHAAA